MGKYLENLLPVLLHPSLLSEPGNEMKALSPLKLNSPGSQFQPSHCLLCRFGKVI